VIQIESVHIKEFRGIRDLALNMGRESFVVYGPNGSGKSGVVDAIQFALTGEIGRLKGTGTADLSLSEHGPHVESRGHPDVSSVRLDVYIPHLKKSASITRTIKKSKQPEIAPNDAAVKAIFTELAEHPEITFSRREIIKFILAEATKRSQDVQALLKLDDIDHTRATLKTTANKLTDEYSTAKTQSKSAADNLMRHLDLPSLKPEDVLVVVNQGRKLLGLQAISELKKDTDLSDGLSQSVVQGEGGQTRESALADINTLSDAAAKGLESSTQDIVKSLLQNIAKLESEPLLLPLVKRHSFLHTGLDLVDGPQCPLCDLEWDINKLRSHLREKLEKSKEAKLVHDQLVESGRAVSAEAIRLRGLIELITKLPETTKEFSTRLSEWSGGLLTFSESLASLDGVIAAKGRFEIGWAAAPESLIGDLNVTRGKVKARPDKSDTTDASSFLVLAQERLNNWRKARRDEQAKEINAALGRSAYKIYCEVSEAALLTLYREVEKEFASYYRLINHDDESEFRAEFEAEDGKLGLLVDVYKKGMFPPGAYHSEGHQDGMGVCLYLALMKRVFDKNFTFAVLDDVVMSVDSQHRKQFCKLLKTKFPSTQFVITTHDQVWAKQLRTEGLVSAKSAVAFHTWTVETGPILDAVTEVWEKIDADLAKNEVPAAAARLRRHLEYVLRELADELGAKVCFRADGGHEMGELFGAGIGRQGDLLNLALKSAKSWDDEDQLEKVEALQKARSEIMAASNVEQWVINKAVHYNEWAADLSKDDFKPVVAAFKQLLQQFRCDKPKCDSWLFVTPRNAPAELRCACGSFHLNLKEQ
jgi:energy-coupling factor transporter ATP-binding protein EcfA2